MLPLNSYPSPKKTGTATTSGYPGYLGSLNQIKQQTLSSNERLHEALNNCKKEREYIDKKLDSLESKFEIAQQNPNNGELLEKIEKKINEMSVRSEVLERYLTLPDSEIIKTNLDDMLKQYNGEQEQQLKQTQKCVIF